MGQGYATPKDYAVKLGVDVGKVLAWIHSGELRAIDISQTRGGRPRWRIPQQAIVDFETARSTRPPAKPVRRRRKQIAVHEFF